MDVFIRVDASSRIGGGHVVRCLALADALRCREARICFVCRHLPEPLAIQVRSRGHELLYLSPTGRPICASEELAHRDWTQAGQEEDAWRTGQALRGRRCDWLVVDHYGLDFQWESRLRAMARAVLVIDDLADRKHECELLLDQNYYADMGERYAGLIGDSTRCLLGPEYALLRPQFRAVRDGCVQPSGDRLFVSVGANDPFHICLRTVEALRLLTRTRLPAEIVLGTDESLRKQVAASAIGLSDTTVHGFVDDIAALMARCTIAIGAAGSSTLERCSVGLPSIVLVAAENQRRMALDLARCGIIDLLGDAADASANTLAGAMAQLLQDSARRVAMRRDGMKLVDGLGLDRVIERMAETL